jgi:hypothetical protein
VEEITDTPTAAPTPTDDDSPIPETWEAYLDFSGQSYYYNPDTGVTRWERPVALPTGLCAIDESELPLVFRTASICTADEPWPEGLVCFVDANFTKISTEVPTVKSAEALTSVDLPHPHQGLHLCQDLLIASEVLLLMVPHVKQRVLVPAVLESTIVLVLQARFFVMV